MSSHKYFRPNITRVGVLPLNCVSTAVSVYTLASSVADPDPGSGAFFTPGSGSGIRNEQPGSDFLELRNHFLGFKILKFFDADPRSGSRIEKFGSSSGIRDGKKSDTGFRIRNPERHPGSATLLT